MTDDARRSILERRARFFAAATMIGVAVGEPACAQTCLEVLAPVCEGDPESQYLVEGPTTLCTGDSTDVTYARLYCGELSDATSRASFTSSNPAVVSVENAKIRALTVGTAVITGKFKDGSGEAATLTIEVTACSDAATDGASEAATDGSDGG